MAVRRSIAAVSNGRDSDVAAVVDVGPTRAEKVPAVGVEAEEGAASEAAAFPGDLGRDVGQRRRPQEPESMSFPVVFLRKGIIGIRTSKAKVKAKVWPQFLWFDEPRTTFNVVRKTIQH